MNLLKSQKKCQNCNQDFLISEFMNLKYANKFFFDIECHYIKFKSTIYLFV